MVRLSESVIPLPPELKNAINTLVGNALMYQLSSYITGTKRAIEIMKSRDEPDQQAIQKHLDCIKLYSKCAGYLNSKFGSKSPGASMIGGTFVLKFDKNKLIDELAAQFKLTPDQQKSLSRIVQYSKFLAEFKQITPFETTLAHIGTQEIQNGYFIKLTVGVMVSRLHDDPLGYVRSLIGVLAHEATHIVQTLVLDGVLKDTKQTAQAYRSNNSGPDTNTREQYLTSPNEFPALLQTFLHDLANQYIKEKIQGNIGKFALQNVNTNIRNDTELNDFLSALKNTDLNKFKKAIKTIYQKTKEVHDNINSDNTDALEDYKIEYLDVAPTPEFMEFFLSLIKNDLSRMSSDQHTTRMLMGGVRAYGTRDNLKAIEYTLPTSSYDGDGNENVSVNIKISAMHGDYSIEIDTTEGFHDSVTVSGDVATKLIKNINSTAKYQTHTEIVNSWEKVLDLNTRYKTVTAETIKEIVSDFGYYRKVQQKFDPSTGILSINDLNIELSIFPANDEELQLITLYFPPIDMSISLTPTVAYRLVSMIFRVMDAGMDVDTICSILENPDSIQYRISTLQKAMYKLASAG